MLVPRLTRPSFYPPRDPNLKDNWRGRVRADQVTVEVDKVCTIMFSGFLSHVVM